jgi:hypothetical protein
MSTTTTTSSINFRHSSGDHHASTEMDQMQCSPPVSVSSPVTSTSALLVNFRL